jgi:U3 small nucleolar RNA-associated protein 5
MAPKQAIAGPSRLKGVAPTAAPPPAPNVSAFNPSLTHFACALPVLGSADKVTIWDVTSDRALHEFEVEGASKVTSLVWTTAPVPRDVKKKRRRKAEEEGLSVGGVEDVVMITTEKGEVMLLSPSRGEVLKKWDVGQIGAAWSGEGYNGVVLATDSAVLLLSSDGGSVAHTYPLPANTPRPTAIAILPSSTKDMLHLIIGTQSIYELHLNTKTNKVSYTSSPLPASTTNIAVLQPLPASPSGTSFLVVSSDDRTVSQYTIPSPKQLAKLTYRYSSPTISPVHSLSLGSHILSLLHSSGEVSLFPLPYELDFARPKSDSKPNTLKLVEGNDSTLVRLCQAGIVPAEGGVKGSVICGRMMGGGRVKWVRAVYELPEGGVRGSTIVKCDAKELVTSGDVENVSCLVQRRPLAHVCPDYTSSTILCSN